MEIPQFEIGFGHGSFHAELTLASWKCVHGWVRIHARRFNRRLLACAALGDKPTT
jgi:hypothetical protein